MILRGVSLIAISAVIACTAASTVAYCEDSKPTDSPAAPTAKDVNFGPYMADLQRKIKRDWYPPIGHESRRIVATFKVHKDGIISNLKMTTLSGIDRVDDAGLAAVESSAPMKPLPDGAPEAVDIQFTFDYNVTANTSLLDKTIDELEKNPDQNADKLTKALLQKAATYAMRKDYSNAEATFKKASAIVEKAHGSQSVDMASLLQTQARDLNCTQEDYAGAKALLEQALGILGKGSHPAELARCEKNMAILVEEPQNHWDAAEQLLLSAVAQAKSSKVNAAQLSSVRELANCYIAEKKKPSAAAVLSETIEALHKNKSAENESINEIAELLYWLNRVDSKKATQLADTYLQEYKDKPASDQYQKLMQVCVLLSDKSTDPEFFAKYGAKYEPAPTPSAPDAKGGS